jgi:gluconate 5-dehydrogenase
MHNSGSIINITSINSIIGFPGNPGYVASKGGLRMLTKALSIDLANRGIRVNAIMLGYFRTTMTASSYADLTLRSKRLKQMVIQRYGEPKEVVGAAIFLASEASSYITGQDICIDGGWTAKGMD